MQTWSDLKMKTKEKVQRIRQHRNRTGGGSPCKITLSELEERIIETIGSFCADGDINNGKFSCYLINSLHLFNSASLFLKSF